MRKILFVLSIFACLGLNACATATVEPGGEMIPTSPPTPTSGPTDTPASNLTTSDSTPGTPADTIAAPARQQLAKELGIPMEQITIQSLEAAEWSDSCLGAAQLDEMCATVITPGYILVLGTPSGNRTYHTNADGNAFRQAPTMLPGIFIEWERSGGVAGLCQRLTIFDDGRYILEDCPNDQILAQGILPEGHLSYLIGLWGSYSTFQWQSETTQEAADTFQDRYNFYGVGATQPSAQDQQALGEYLGNLATEVVTLPNFVPPAGSGIWGQVLTGPTCPGPQRLGDTECADKPYQATITILDSNKNTVTQFTTDADGRFQLPLAPGTYIVHPETTGVYPAAGEQTITVTANQYLTVTIVYDTGLR